MLRFSLLLALISWYFGPAGSGLYVSVQRLHFDHSNPYLDSYIYLPHPTCFYSSTTHINQQHSFRESEYDRSTPGPLRGHRIIPTRRGTRYRVETYFYRQESTIRAERISCRDAEG